MAAALGLLWASGLAGLVEAVRAAETAAVRPAIAAADWPQLGRDPQRSNYSPQQVNGPYCYAWKWYGVPFASRAQPVVAAGRLYIGGMDGKLYARDASTGAALWTYATGGAIRHSPAVLGGTVVTGSHDGYTYALEAVTGGLLWQTYTGPSQTAPLLDEARGWVYVASTDGSLRALSLANGAQQWAYFAGAPLLASPALSADGARVFVASEAMHAIAVNAATGVLAWRTTLPGQSLADRYPVVAGGSVIFRTQPLYHFHLLLREGDDVLDAAGGLNPDWAADWANVRPQITQYLTAQPAKQTLFILNASTGVSAGVAPVLYTFGNNDIPSAPVVRDGAEVFVTYRARHGIQTDSPNAVHVTTDYDAELGRLNLATLDITGLTASQVFNYQFRLTSDEPGVMTMGGNLLWIDNWERAGGLNVSTGQLLHLGNVSNTWPECYSGNTCGPVGANPYFPLTSGGQAYPFPWPRITDGAHLGGIVVANSMLYWRVLEGGLAGIRTGPCGAPPVWTSAQAPAAVIAAPAPAAAQTQYLPLVARHFAQLRQYIDNDLTTPVANPASDLVQRLRSEVQAMLTLANGQHLLPLYVERGFSNPNVWPYDSANCSGQPTCVANIHYSASGLFGNVFWHDPGELLYTLAAAYPYLDPALQTQTRTYMAAEMNRYPPLQNLPYGDANRDWLRQGVARERYAVPFRAQLNNWPPVAANLSAVYAVWLWAKNTNDWTYACAHWGEAKALFNARRNTTRYYADLAGLIGYARLARDLRTRGCAGVSAADYDTAVAAALAVMEAGRGAANFGVYRDRANAEYWDPRGVQSGWSAPVFFGLTPEVGLYLRQQTDGAAAAHLLNLQSGNGVQWWYLTRAGVHAEEGETSFMLPWTAWSHFLGRAYLTGEPQTVLRGWLDRPWTTGDLYSLQKLVAAIHAP